VRELHHRQVAGHLQRELVAVLALGFGGARADARTSSGTPASSLSGGVVGEGIGGVERVLAELLAAARPAFLDGGEAFLAAPCSSAPPSTKLRMAFLSTCCAALLGSRPAGSMALYLA
jgi:hypothetical protein